MLCGWQDIRTNQQYRQAGRRKFAASGGQLQLSGGWLEGVAASHSTILQPPNEKNLSNERHVPSRGCIQEGGRPILVVLGRVLSHQVAHTLQVGTRLHQQQPVSKAGSIKTMIVSRLAGAVCCVTRTPSDHVPAAPRWQHSCTMATGTPSSMHPAAGARLRDLE